MLEILVQINIQIYNYLLYAKLPGRLTKEFIVNKEKRIKKSAFKKDANKYFIENNILYYGFIT